VWTSWVCRRPSCHRKARRCAWLRCRSSAVPPSLPVWCYRALTSESSPLACSRGWQKHVELENVTGTATVDPRRRARAQPTRRSRRRPRCRAVEVTRGVPRGARERDESIGIDRTAGDLAVGELSPVNPVGRRGQRGGTVHVYPGPLVSLCGLLSLGEKWISSFLCFP